MWLSPLHNDMIWWTRLVKMLAYIYKIEKKQVSVVHVAKSCYRKAKNIPSCHLPSSYLSIDRDHTYRTLNSKGRSDHEWSCNTIRWKNFRIERKAGSGNKWRVTVMSMEQVTWYFGKACIRRMKISAIQMKKHVKSTCLMYYVCWARPCKYGHWWARTWQILKKEELDAQLPLVLHTSMVRLCRSSFLADGLSSCIWMYLIISAHPLHTWNFRVGAYVRWPSLV